MIATMPLSEAQSALYSINDIYTTNSLIREFQPGIDIVYNDKGQQSFLYVDRLGGMVYEAPSPYQIEVTDMEIYRVVDNIDVVASGMIDGNLAIMKMETGESECVPSSELTVDISKEPPHCSVFVHDVSNCKVLPVIVNPEITEYGIERICGEENRNENKK